MGTLHVDDALSQELVEFNLVLNTHTSYPLGTRSGLRLDLSFPMSGNKVTPWYTAGNGSLITTFSFQERDWSHVFDVLKGRRHQSKYEAFFTGLAVYDPNWLQASSPLRSQRWRVRASILKEVRRLGKKVKVSYTDPRISFFGGLWPDCDSSVYQNKAEAKRHPAAFKAFVRAIR